MVLRMAPVSDRAKATMIELLRWIAVLPMAMLCNFGTQMIMGVLAWVFMPAGWWNPPEHTGLFYAFTAIRYAPKESMFVVGGASVAPRKRVVVAALLALLVIVL